MTVPGHYNSRKSIKMNIKELSAHQFTKSIPETERELILNSYKRGGSFSVWNQKSWWLMADALTYTEDALELEQGASRNQPKIEVRKSIKMLRRVLEDYLDNSSCDWFKTISSKNNQRIYGSRGIPV